jgi:hypothetical protein
MMETVFSVGFDPKVYNEVPSPTEVELRETFEGWQYSWEFRCGVLTRGQRRHNGSWSISIVKIRYQETSSENIAEE